MGQIDAYELLQNKKKICSNDLQEAFKMSQPNASRIMRRLLKLSDVNEKLVTKRRPNGTPYIVVYAVLKKK